MTRTLPSAPRASRPPGAAPSPRPSHARRQREAHGAASPASASRASTPASQAGSAGYRVHMTVYNNTPCTTTSASLPPDWNDELEALRRDGTYFVPSAGGPPLFSALPPRLSSSPCPCSDSDPPPSLDSSPTALAEAPRTMTQLNRVTRFDREAEVPPSLSDIAQSLASEEQGHPHAHLASVRSSPLAYTSAESKAPDVDLRFGPIEIEFADATDSASTSSRSSVDQQRGPLAAFHAQSTFSIDDVAPDSAPARPSCDSFTTGSTDVTFGVVHLFRDRVDADRDAHDPQSFLPPPPQQAAEMGTILAVLAVPATMTASDFLEFVEPAVGAISHLRMIRETLPNRAMVLLKFRDADDAEEFYKLFHGQPYSALRPGHVPGSDASSVAAQAAAGLRSEFDIEATPASSALTVGLQELPTCAVCLERLDASISGLMTIACQHTFHCACLSRWGASRCPVCRYTSGGGVAQAAARCVTCGASDDLWVCLLCAAVGCGRYSAAHAHAHYQVSGHRYSLELDTQRVWDYIDDRYVHRLLRTKDDGGLVELSPDAQSAAKRADYPGETSASAAAAAQAKAEADADASATHAVLMAAAGRYEGGGGGADSAAAEKKLESVGLEFSYLLSSQLEKQRRYYEAALRAKLRRSQEAEQRAHSFRQVLVELQGKHEDLTALLEQARGAATEAALARDSAALETNKLKRRAAETAGQLAQERAMTKALSANLHTAEAAACRARAEMAEQAQELADQRDLNRDLMFQIESMQAVGAAGVDGELAGATVLPLPPKSLSRAEQFRQRMHPADQLSGEPGGAGKKKGKKKKKPTGPGPTSE